MNGSRSHLDFSKVASEVAPIQNIFASHGGTGGASSTNTGAKKSNSIDLRGEQTAKHNATPANNTLSSKKTVK